MKKKAAAVTAVVALLGILAAALGFAAEATRVKTEDLKFNYRTYACIYPESPAGYLALAAAGLLLVAQIITVVFAGCVCSSNNRGGSSSWGRTIACIIGTFAWITSVVGIILLLRVAALHSFGKRTSSGVFPRFCFVVRPGVAASGGALALISVWLGIAYYRSAERLKEDEEMQVQQFRSEIPIAQPQFPAQPHVLTYEYPYNHRQIA